MDNIGCTQSRCLFSTGFTRVCGMLWTAALQRQADKNRLSPFSSHGGSMRV